MTARISSAIHVYYVYSFHDGNLNFYDPQATASYNGNEITGIQSPKVQFHSCLNRWFSIVVFGVSEVDLNFAKLGEPFHLLQVLEVGRSYFGCSDLPYVPLENNGEESAMK